MTTPLQQPASGEPPADGRAAAEQERGALLRALADAAQVLNDQLLRGEGPEPQRARALLASRAVPRAAAVAHQLGYARPGWTALTRRLQAAGHSEQVLLDAGLCLRTRRGTLVDRFRDRLTFPLHDPGGTVIGFLGRTVPPAPGAPAAAPGAGRSSSTPHRVSAGQSGQASGQALGQALRQALGQAKYLNSPDSSLCRKHEVLYGLGDPPTRAALAAGAQPVLVEGPLDALAVTWASRAATTTDTGGSMSGPAAGATGGPPTRYVGLAGCGTALSPEQASLLVPLAGQAGDRLVVAYDSDPAGRAGAIRALGVLLAADLWPATCLLPDGADPAALSAAAGGAALHDALDRAVPLADVAADAHLQRWDTRWAEGTIGAARDAAALIAQLPAEHIARQVQRVADRLRLPAGQVTGLVAAAISAPPCQPCLPPSDVQRPRSARRAPGTTPVTGPEPRVPGPGGPVPGVPGPDKPGAGVPAATAGRVPARATAPATARLQAATSPALRRR